MMYVARNPDVYGFVRGRGGYAFELPAEVYCVDTHLIVVIVHCEPRHMRIVVLERRGVSVRAHKNHLKPMASGLHLQPNATRSPSIIFAKGALTEQHSFHLLIEVSMSPGCLALCPPSE